ncbi:MAG: hypothetical protein IPO91_03475 [Chloroflexi bacterium]|nr:hypothetical protein [Chloroflexota bacterium]
MKSDSPVIEAAVKFVLKKEIPGTGLWGLGNEGFLYKDASGQVIYNNFFSFDAVKLLLLAEYRGTATYYALQGFLEAQKENGIWNLFSPNEKVTAVETWSTAECVTLLDLASKTYVGYLTQVYKPPQLWRSKLFVGTLILLVILETAYILGLGTAISQWWTTLPEATQSLILVGVVLAIGTNLVAAFMYDQFKNWLTRMKNQFLKYLAKNINKEGK